MPHLPSALLGYFTTARQAEFANAEFTRLLNACNAPAQTLNGSFCNRAHAAGVAGWGRHTQFKQFAASICASLSASALATSLDIQINATATDLTLARDAFGSATIYWLEREQTVWFSSRLQLLLPLLDDPKVDDAAFYGYACFSYVPTPLSPLLSIQALAAGQKVKFTVQSNIHAEFDAAEPPHHWREASDLLNDESAAIRQCQQHLTASTEKLIADVSHEPVGIFLSGGLDSSIVAALLSRAGIQARAYTLDFGEYGFSEMTHAETVARHLKLPLTKVDASPRKIAHALRDTVHALDVPYGDGVTVPLYLLNQAASLDGCAVVFNGEGGDQLFAGWTNKPLIASDVYQGLHPQQSNFAEDYLRTFHRLHAYESEALHPARQAAAQNIAPLNWLAGPLDGSGMSSLLHRLRRANLMLKGAQNIQPRATQLSLAHNLAVRSPFCDRALAEWTFSLSPELFLRESHEKFLLKRAVEDWLPSDIVWREKRGMGVPLTQWCLGPLWRTLGNWLQPTSLRASQTWQADVALRLAAGRFSGQIQGRRIGEILWLILMWELWRNVVLRQPVERSLLHAFQLPASFWRWYLNRI